MKFYLFDLVWLCFVLLEDNFLTNLILNLFQSSILLGPFRTDEKIKEVVQKSSNCQFE